MTITELMNDYDWENVFDYASPEEAEPNSKVSRASFERKDVKRIIAYVEGENDGPDWVIVVELKDGRFASIRAGCDYTGWDCQAWGSSNVAESEDKIIRFGLSNEERTRLGLMIGEGTMTDKEKALLEWLRKHEDEMSENDAGMFSCGIKTYTLAPFLMKHKYELAALLFEEGEVS